MLSARALLAVLAFVASVCSAANPPAADSGLTWLGAQCQANGTLAGENSSLGTVFQARSDALIALAQLSTAPSALANVVSQEPEDSVEYLARKIVALARLGSDVSARVAALQSVQNADGGFGANAGYQSNVLDTAYALLAFKAAPSADGNAIAMAAAYLVANQGTDGSFAFSEQASVYVASYALQALNAFVQSNSLGNAAQAAKNWLVARQNAGSYGSVLENAVAAIALAGATTDTSVFSGPQLALIAAQDPDNKSWSGDPYLTALAIRALVATGTAPPPVTTGSISGVVVDATTGAPIAAAIAQASGPIAAAANSDGNGAFSISALPAGTYAVQVTKAGYATFNLTASVFAGVATNLGTVRLPVAGTDGAIQGTVRDGITGQPIAGVTVTVGGSLSATTDVSGNYQINGIAPGTVSVSVSKTGYQTVNATATLTAGAVVVFSPSLYPPGQGPADATLIGKVVDAATAQGIANATIKVGTLTTSTGADGTFSLSGLTAGSVSIEISAPEYGTATVSGTLASGTNDAGIIALARSAASARVSGIVTDAATGLPIGGASVTLQGGSLSASTNSAGFYELADIRQTQFMLAIAAPGYQSRTVSVTLPSLADATVNAALDRVQTVGLTLNRVSTSSPSFDPYAGVEISAEIQSTLTQPADLTLMAIVQDSVGTTVLMAPPVDATVAAGAHAVIKLETYLDSQPPGNYSAVVRGYDPGGALLMEGSAGFVINAVTKFAANIGIDPPIIQYGTGQAVKLEASVFNHGNLTLPAGGVELTITLDTPDTQVLPKVTPTITRILDGAPASNLWAGTYDANDNLFVLNGSDRRVIKYSAAGDTTVLPPLPSASYMPRSLAIDSAGILYALDSYNAIVKYDTATGTSRGSFSTGTSFAYSFDRDAAGNFYVAGTDGAHSGVHLFKLDSSGGNKQALVGPGFTNPIGITQARDGNLYVANYYGASISKVDAAGRVTPFADGITYPYGIAQGPDGLFYVTAGYFGTIPNAVVQIDATGQGKTAWITGLSAPRDLRFDASGNLFILNGGNNSIVKVPAGSRTPQPFARSVASNPQGIAYDIAGNLYITSADWSVSRLDTSDNASVLATNFVTPSGIAVNAGGDLFVSVSGGVMKRSGSVSSPYATGLASPKGLAIDAAGVVYAAETSADQITAIASASSPTPFVQSMATAATDVQVASNGDRYVLNERYLARLPAAGAPSIISRFATNAVSLAIDPAGGFYVHDSWSVKKLSATGAVVRTTNVPYLAPGIAAGLSGDVFVVESASGNVRQIDATGTLLPTPYVALGASTLALVGDGAGGMYALLATSRIMFVSPGKVVTPLGTLYGGRKIALDSAGNELYLTTNTGIVAVSTSGGAVRTVVSQRTNLYPIGFGSGSVFAVDTNTREVLAYSTQGTLQGTIAGFYQPGGIAWNGSQLVISDLRRVLTVSPGGYPEILAYQPLGDYLVVSGGYVYGTKGGAVVRVSLDPSLTPAQRTAEVFHTVSGATRLTGLALRADGALTVASPADNRIEVISLADRSLLASYAGIVDPTGLAVDASGNVYVSSSGSSQKIVRFDPTGKRSTVFSPTQAAALAFDGNGQLHATEANGEVYRYDASGNKTIVGRSNGPNVSGFLAGMVVTAAGDMFLTDASPAIVRKKAPTGNLLEPFAAGLSDPRAVRIGADGAVYVGNQSNSTIVKYSNGRLELVGYGFPGLYDIAVARSGRVYVTSSVGELAVYDTTGLLLPLPGLLEQGGIGTPHSLAMGSGETIAAFTSSRAFRYSLAYTPGSPPPGTVLPPITRSMEPLAAGAGSTSVDFGSWVPPYAGQYSFALRPLASGVDGAATNALHAGPGATGVITTSRPSLPSGDSPVGVNIRLTGADFTSVAKVDAAKTSFLTTTGPYFGGLGPDAAGNVYFSRLEHDPRTAQLYNVLYKAVPAGNPEFVYRDLNAGTNRGMLPVDDAGNLYMISGPTNRDVRVVPLGHPADASIYKTFDESIVGLAIDSARQIVVLTVSRLLRIRNDAARTVEVLRTLDTNGGATYGFTIDGRDNIYVQFVNPPWNSFRGSLVKYAPDGSSTTIQHLDAYPSFEYEGLTIAGDCADNLFMAPLYWPLVGQTYGEETTLVQLNGRTNSVAQILDGRTINSDLTDMDTLVYDRFSGAILIWTDRNNGNVYRVPVKCGTLNADVHVVFPPAQEVAGFNVPTKAVIARADGSREYVWNLNDVSNLGSSVAFDTTLAGLRLGDVRPVASEAFLSFQNPFLPGEVKQAIPVPTVGVDGMVDVVATTDHPSYPAHADVATNITLANRDPAAARGGTLDVRVFDAQGILVATLAQQGVTVPPGSSIEVTPPFNTGVILVGSYRITAGLTDTATGIAMSASTAGFDVIADGTRLISSVSTDRQAYQAIDTVTVNGRVKNVSVNSIASDLKLALVVTGPGGGVLLQDSRSVASLGPGALRDAFFSLRLNAAPAGNYNVQLTLLEAGVTLETRSTAFTVLSTVDSGSGLRGSLAAASPANRGEPVAITATLSNQGNAPLASLPVTIKVVNPQSGAIVQQWTSTIALAQGAQQSVSQTWDTSGAAGGSYIAAASVSFSGREIVLGQATVTVGELQPLVFAPRANVALGSVVESNAATVAGLVRPAAISIAGGEYRIGSGAWTATAGTVSAGSTVSVRVTAAGTPGTTTTATLTVAGIANAFAVTTVSQDVTPDPFAFTAQANVAPGAAVISNAVTISGIDVAVPISVAGGEYRLNGGAWSSAAGSVTAGTQVELRVTAAATSGTTTSATLTVSTISAAFSVTTTSEDRLPDAFAFAPRTNVDLSTPVESDAVTIAGINVPVPIAVSGGEYKVNLGAFTSAAGTVSAGDTVTVRLTSSDQYATSKSANLTVSGFSTGFAVTTREIPAVTPTLAFSDAGRVLVLVSCKGSQGNNDIPCVDQRRSFVAGALNALGIEHLIVTDTDAFRTELRCGRWNTFWLSGGAEKLKGTLADELREAVFGGAGYLVDGEHDQRNGDLDEVMGVTYRGKSDQGASVVLSGAMFPAGSFTHGGGSLLLELSGGERQASFVSSAGAPAIVSRAYGAGRAMQFAFDWVATMMAQPGSAFLRDVMGSALDWVAPAARSRFTADGQVTVSTRIENPAVVSQEVELVATLPPGFQFVASTPMAQEATGATIRWRRTLAAGEAATIEWSVRAAQAAGPYALSVTIYRVEGATTVMTGTRSLIVDVVGLESGTAQLVASLNALTLASASERSARDAAATAVLTAQAKASAGNFESALSQYVSAVASLKAITSVPVAEHRSAVDLLMEAVRRLWCRASLGCPVSAANGSAYNVLVLGSASFSNGDSQGPIGVGGSASLGGYTVASRLRDDPARLIVGGSLAWQTTGSVGQGSSGVIRVAGAADVGMGVGRRELVAGLPVEDWAVLVADHLARSDTLATQAGAPATASGGGNTLTCSGASATWNVCSMTSAQVAEARTINLQYPATASVLVNVTGGAATFSGGRTNWNGQGLQGSAAAKQVIFNLAQAGSLVVDGWQWGGTLLAPRASVTHANSTIDGQAVFGNLNSTGSFQCSGTFQGQLP